jgi:hypothetical protein
MMTAMHENDDHASWLESRGLIISQLTSMDASIRELSIRIDRYSEVSRERTAELSKVAQSETADLKLRVAVLEMRAKIWSATLGLIRGGVATGALQLILGSLHR